MDLTPYVDRLRRELVVAAEPAGDDARVVAERLTAALDSALRLTLLDAFSAAAAEITRDLAPGSVDVRLRGRDPEFVVNPPPHADTTEPAPPDDVTPDPGDGATARINLRLPEHLKARAEEAAGRERLSVNAWLVRAVAAALQPTDRAAARGPQIGQRFTGWVR